MTKKYLELSMQRDLKKKQPAFSANFDENWTKYLVS